MTELDSWKAIWAKLLELQGYDDLVKDMKTSMYERVKDMPATLSVYKGHMKSLRELGEAELDLGSRSIKTANFIEPLIDQMIASGQV